MIPGVSECSEQDLALGVGSCLSIHQWLLPFISTVQATNAFLRSGFVWSVILAVLNSHHKQLREREISGGEAQGRGGRKERKDRTWPFGEAY